MEIKNYKKGDELYIIELFEKVFGKKMSLEYWKWRFEDNPAGKHMIKLMWEDEILIGHYALSPVFLNVENRKVLSALSMTTMTHPDYTGLGVFGKLSDSLYDSIKKNYGVEIVWGFPNNNSHYGFINKLSWKNIGVCHEIGISTSKLKHFNSDYSIEEVSEFSNEHLEIIKNTNKKFKVSVDKSLEYLTWRYLKHPSQNYRIFQISKDDSLKGCVVSKIYKNVDKTWSLNVLEIANEIDLDVIGSITEHILNEYQQNIEKITLWLSLFDESYPLFEKLGFIPTGNLNYLAFRDSEGNSCELEIFKNWSYSFGDSDVY